MMQTQEGQDKVKRGRQARNTGASQLANQHIGERIRLRRTLLGLSQSELGKVLGLSFQQLQKYERGASAIGAGQLCGIARALDVPVSFFYDGLDGVTLPMNSDAGERQYQLVRDELEVLGHYRAVPGFIREAIRCLLGYVSHQHPGQDRDLARRAAAKKKDPAASSPPADDTGRLPTHDGAGPDPAAEESPGAGADAEPGRDAAAGMLGSASPDDDRAHSEPLEQPLPAKRRRGRPRKAADTAQSEPVPVQGRPGESAAFAAETLPFKPRDRRGVFRKPSDVVAPAESEGRSLAESNVPPRPDSTGGNKRTPGTRSASGPGRTSDRGETPADGRGAGGNFSQAGKPPASEKTERNKRSHRRAYGATWSPSDIGT